METMERFTMSVWIQKAGGKSTHNSYLGQFTVNCQIGKTMTADIWKPACTLDRWWWEKNRIRANFAFVWPNQIVVRSIQHTAFGKQLTKFCLILFAEFKPLNSKEFQSIDYTWRAYIHFTNWLWFLIRQQNRFSCNSRISIEKKCYDRLFEAKIFCVAHWKEPHNWMAFVVWVIIAPIDLNRTGEHWLAIGEVIVLKFRILCENFHCEKKWTGLRLCEGLCNQIQRCSV